MSEEEQIALLASDGMLVKRPLLGDGYFCPAGFPPRRLGKKPYYNL